MAQEKPMSSSCPISVLKMKPQCEFPKRRWKQLALTPKHEKALHDYAKTVVAAGEKLYKTVPREKAEPVIRKKWLEVATQLRRSARAAPAAAAKPKAKAKAKG
jgi:hypothetical protein